MMSPLRQRMLEDMQLRNLSKDTQKSYLHYITGLARFYMISPDQLGLEEIREYQLYMINDRRYSPESVNTFVSAAKFLYNVTLETPWPEGVLPRCRVPHQLPVVLSAAGPDRSEQSLDPSGTLADHPSLSVPPRKHSSQIRGQSPDPKPQSSKTH